MKTYIFKTTAIVVLSCIIISFIACSNTYRYQLRDIKPLKGETKNEIQLLLKNGEELKLNKFELLTDQVIGTDTLGNKRNVPINDIEKIFIIEESSTGRKIVSTVLMIGLISYVVSILLILLIGVPGSGLQ